MQGEFGDIDEKLYVLFVLGQPLFSGITAEFTEEIGEKRAGKAYERVCVLF